MKSWSYADISTRKEASFHVEFLDELVGKPEDVSGLVEFNLDGTDYKFQVQAIWNQRSSHNLKVDWNGIDASKYVLFPPPNSDGISDLGWSNGCLCLVVQQNSNTSLSRHSTSITEWMAGYSDVIGPLSLCETTLPGSHNSGTYKCVAKWPASAYIQCQDISLIDQLRLGIRVLDLRVAQCGDGGFILSHDKWRTQYSLKEALLEIVKFIDETEKELVILDFHRFNNISSNDFNFPHLKEQIKEHLNGYTLSYFDGAMSLSLNSLWSDHALGKKRVIVTWNSVATRDADMWPGIYQVWYNEAKSIPELHSCLEQTFEKAPQSYACLWSVCVFRTVSFLETPKKNARDLQPEIDSWFYGCADWTMKANIISIDFCDRCNNVIHASIGANILKGAKKREPPTT